MTMPCDEFGNIYAQGHSQYPVDLDPGPDEYILGPGEMILLATGTDESDGLVLKLSSDLEFVWEQHWRSYDEINIKKVEIGSDNLCVVTGEYMGPVDFMPGLIAFETPTNGGRDVYLLKLNPDGAW